MPLALLLSPDDQAVSAITAVLAEMSVTCERPMDGATAARQLCAQNFDLVLLDCENLPAAQLIFDVCRRGKGGKNPVPIAIVDGHTGLPTAFRLGAELILTKPVAMDQARSTIRGAVSRVKKEQTASSMQPAQPEIATANDTKVEAAVSVAAASAGCGEANTPAPEYGQSSLTVATAVCSQGVSTLEALVHAMAEHSETSSATATPQIEAPAATEDTPLLSEPESAHASCPPCGDPVLAELEEMETKHRSQTDASVEAPAKPKSSALQTPQKNENRSKSRTLVSAVAALLLVCCGVYAAWMTRPEFRSLAQQQISRVLTLAGKPSSVRARVAVPVAVKPAVLPTPPPSTSAPGADAAQTSQPATTQTPDAATTAAAAPAVANAHATTVPSPLQTQAAMPAQNVGPTSPAATLPAKTIEVSKRAPVQSTGAAQSPDGRKPSMADAAPAVANPEVVLSSKGAEKRLIHSVKPAYPASVKVAAENSTVVLKAVIDNDGNVVGTQLVNGNAALAESAAAAVKQWHYRPYVRDGKSLPFQTIVMLDFSRP